MANEVVGVELRVDGSGSLETVKSFRQQIKEAQQELLTVQERFGDISPEAQKAAKAVAELRDRLKDSNEVAALFDPEKKFQAVVGVAQGIASGFAAATGTLALFGVESKEVEKTLLKVQAAMALAQGLSGVAAAAEDFKRLGAVLGQIGIVQKANATLNTAAATTMRLFGVATTQTGLAFNALKAAIAATGIGLIVVGIVMLIQKIKEFTEANDEATASQKALNDAILDGARTIRDAAIARLNDAEALAKARAKAAGATEAQIAAIEKDYQHQRLEALRDYREKTLNDQKENANARFAVEHETTQQEIKELDAKTKAREDAEKKAETAQQKAKAASDKLLADRKAAGAAAVQAEQQTADELFAIQHTAEMVELRSLSFKFAERIAAFEKAGKDTAALIVAWETAQAAIVQQFADERKAKEDALALKKKEDMTALLAKQDEDAQAELAHTQAMTDAKIALAEKERDAKVNAAQSVSNALSGFAALAGEQTAAGKAFAVTAATIQAILGAQQAFTALSSIPIVGPILGGIAAAGAIAMGIANVKKILAVQVPGKGAGGGSAAGLGSIASAAPLAPQQGGSQPVKLDQQSINSMGNATVKAVVVESDITGSQQRITRIQQAAKFK